MTDIADLLKNQRKYAQEMRIGAFESAYMMAKVIKDCNGDLDEMISYLERKVEEETKLNEHDCEG